jgi:uncharacterized protein
MAELFISYSRHDQRFVEKVAGQLEAAGISVWMDIAGIDAGERWRSEITKAIERCRWFLLVISPTSMASPQVAREVILASEKERPIVPIIVERCDVAESLEFALAGLHHVDFETATFDDGIAELRRALGATEIAFPVRSATFTDDDRDARVLGRGIAFPLRVDGRGGIGTVGPTEAVEESILMILQTRPGERVGRPDFGCDVGEHLFERPDASTLTAFANVLRDSIQRWEPRARDVEVEVEPRFHATFDVSVRFSLVTTDDPRELRTTMMF